MDAPEVSSRIPGDFVDRYLNCTDDAVIFIRDSEILYWNRRARQMFGFADAEPGLGMPVMPSAAELFVTGVPESGAGCVSLETTCRRRDGTCFPVAIHITADSDNRRLFAIRDESERVATEESLRRRSAQLTATIASLPFDFWINDSENRTLFQNPYSRALWGDKIGSKPAEVTEDSEILAIWNDTNRRAFAGEIHRGEITYSVDGEERTFRNIVAPVRDADEIIGILGLNIDITDYLKIANDREILLRELHHRVRNNLQVILSTIALGRGKTSFDPERLLTRIENHIHAIYLVHEQLYIGNELSEIDLGEYARNLGASIDRTLALRSRIQVRSETASVPIEKAVPLGIALCELLANAARYGKGTEDGGIVPITVSVLPGTADATDTVELCVKNPVGDDTAPVHAVRDGGLEIASLLVDQLRGTIEVTLRDSSFIARIVIPM